jgi:oxygen-independent coproporphyrinogen-3 oxidase
MAGIYIHIPFCKRRCVYCDFYSTTHSEWREEYIHALCHELQTRKDYLADEEVDSVYLGGGTPSQLTPLQLQRLFAYIYKVYRVRARAEVTMECNPDDLTPDYIEALRSLPVNRLSLGIQTFHEPTLQLLQRRHTARQAIEAYHRCRQAGFHNISIDLMYGLPGETLDRWQQDLRQAVELHPEHISAYHLIYEEGTALWRLREEHQVAEADEDLSVSLFSTLIHTLRQAGYEHYEISNFALPGLHARHNSGYWTGMRYLGCGPSAHSYNGTSRQWNEASLPEYLKAYRQGREFPHEIEPLDKDTRYNDFIITRVRTKWGLPLAELEAEFGTDYLQYCLKMANPHLAQGTLVQEDGVIRLSEAGIFVSDGIMSDLLRV